MEKLVKNKTCTKCGDEHPATTEYFPPHKWTKDKLDSWCRFCHRKASRECNKKYRHTIKGHLQNIYSSMKHRCSNPDNKRYKDYGGRGIKCLFESVDEFRNCVIGLGYGAYEKIKRLQIDRINNDGHYEPGNIRFVTRKENCNNRRNVR